MLFLAFCRLSAATLLCGSVMANAASFNIPDSNVAALKAATGTGNTSHESDIRAIADQLGSSNNDYDLHLLDSFFDEPTGRATLYQRSATEANSYSPSDSRVQRDRDWDRTSLISMEQERSRHQRGDIVDLHDAGDDDWR